MSAINKRDGRVLTATPGGSRSEEVTRCFSAHTRSVKGARVLSSWAGGSGDVGG